jgi:phosphoglycerol transferase MdoB-like AlkP superfamily enzyme
VNWVLTHPACQVVEVCYLAWLNTEIMIQRIQTVYLLMAASAMILTLVLPLGQVESGGLMIDVPVKKILIALIPGALSALVAAINIFLFRNRPLQMRLAMLGGALSVLTLLVLLYTAFVTYKEPSFVLSYQTLLMPFFAGAFNLLAYRGVKADEQLVRSMDRLR